MCFRFQRWTFTGAISAKIPSRTRRLTAQSHLSGWLSSGFLFIRLHFSNFRLLHLYEFVQYFSFEVIFKNDFVYKGQSHYCKWIVAGGCNSPKSQGKIENAFCHAPLLLIFHSDVVSLEKGKKKQQKNTFERQKMKEKWVENQVSEGKAWLIFALVSCLLSK